MLYADYSVGCLGQEQVLCLVQPSLGRDTSKSCRLCESRVPPPPPPPPSRFLLCSPVTMMAAVSAQDKAIVVLRGNCTFCAKAVIAQSANATFLVMIYNDTELVSVHSMWGSSLVPRPPMWPGNEPWGPSVTTVLYTNLIQTVSVFLYIKHKWQTFSSSVIIANLYVFSSALLYWFQNHIITLAISKIALY